MQLLIYDCSCQQSRTVCVCRSSLMLPLPCASLPACLPGPTPAGPRWHCADAHPARPHGRLCRDHGAAGAHLQRGQPHRRGAQVWLGCGGVGHLYGWATFGTFGGAALLMVGKQCVHQVFNWTCSTAHAPVSTAVLSWRWTRAWCAPSARSPSGPTPVTSSLGERMSCLMCQPVFLHH